MGRAPLTIGFGCFDTVCADKGVCLMSEKPSYLGLLNAIAVGESGGETLFQAWAATTPSDDVRCVLHTVALREGEHARAFAKRIDELGFNVRDRPDPDMPKRVDIARSTTMSDCEKFERLGFGKDPGREPDIFARFFDDTSMDIQTGELMGRYVAEERDTGRRLRACHALLQAAQPAVAPDRAEVPGALLERLDRLECTLTELAERTIKAEKKARKAAKKLKRSTTK